jgi:hypothetical protein
MTRELLFGKPQVFVLLLNSAGFHEQALPVVWISKTNQSALN